MEAEMKFEKLLSPIKISTLELKNRMVMAPMVTNFATREGYVTQRLKDYYEERAKGGVALIIGEASCVSYPVGLATAHQIGIYDDRQIPGLKELVDVVHKNNCKFAFQLHHAGHRATRSLTGYQAVSASEIADEGRWAQWIGGEPPRALTVSEIEQLVAAYAAAAVRAKTAGADAVQLHGAHGYLILNFLSPLYNRRTDKYGGDIKGRTRFAQEIVQLVRQKVGKDFPILFRISGEEGVEGGLRLEEATVICSILEEAGVDSFDVTSGSHDCFQEVVPPLDFPSGWRVYMAEAIKQVVRVPVMTTGRIQSPELAESILREGRADLIGLGRSLISDPEFPQKIAQGKANEIRRCIACNQGCIARLRTLDLEGSSLMTCLQNPLVGHEKDFALRPAKVKKRVAVIGGGVAGMEAAVIAASRGHLVTLFEKESILGGQMILAAIPPHKEEINNITRYFENQLPKLGVKVELGKKATPEIVERLKPDVVILAAGGIPFVPPIDGARGRNVVQAWDVLKGKETGDKVVIVGGNMVGCDTADFLAAKGKKVTIVTRFPAIAQDMEFVRRGMLLDRFAKYPIEIRTNVGRREIVSDGVIIGDGEKVVADIVILAQGVVANRELEWALLGKPWALYCVGDCDIPGNIMTAIHRAFQVARQL
jgi:2,4-dienoyl-CoA reductase-like NADH-dependent reductase (Old Yellow Enzyme family)/thioredoxin reductase